MVGFGGLKRKLGVGLGLPLVLLAAGADSDAAKWMALGVEHAVRGDYAGAEEPFHRACLLDAKLAGACLYFGRTLYLLDRFEQAVSVLRTALANDPGNAQIYRIEIGRASCRERV